MITETVRYDNTAYRTVGFSKKFVLLAIVIEFHYIHLLEQNLNLLSVCVASHLRLEHRFPVDTEGRRGARLVLGCITTQDYTKWLISDVKWLYVLLILI